MKKKIKSDKKIYLKKNIEIKIKRINKNKNENEKNKVEKNEQNRAN